jgi:hypothetical protein
MKSGHKTEFVRRSKRFKAKYFAALEELFGKKIDKDVKDDKRETQYPVEAGLAKGQNTNRVL